MSYKIISYSEVKDKKVLGGRLEFREIIIDLGDGINKDIKLNYFYSNDEKLFRIYISDENNDEIESGNLFEYVNENLGID